MTIFNKILTKLSKPTTFSFRVSLSLNACFAAILLFSLLSNKPIELGAVIADDQEKIYEKDIDIYLGVMKNEKGEVIGFNYLTNVQQEAVVKQILIKKRLLKIAHKKKIDLDQDIIILSEKYKNDLIIKRLSLQMLSTYNKIVTDEDINKYYDDLQKSVKKLKVIKLYHILSAEKSEAQAVSRKVRASIKANDRKKDIVKKFSKIARSYSTDVNTVLKGGDLGYIVSNKLKPEIQAYLPKLSVYKISKPIKTDMGWHILMATEIKDATFEDLDSMKDKLKGKIAANKLKIYIESLVAKK